MRRFITGPSPGRGGRFCGGSWWRRPRGRDDAQPLAQDRYRRLVRRGKRPQEAVVAVARHMLELVWIILKKETVFKPARKQYLTIKFRSVLRKAHGRCPHQAAPTLVNAVMGWKTGQTASS